MTIPEPILVNWENIDVYKNIGESGSTRLHFEQRIILINNHHGSPFSSNKTIARLVADASEKLRLISTKH